MKSVFLIGIVAGMAASIGIAAVISALFTQSTAQMMGGNMGMMGNGVMAGDSQLAGPWHGGKAAFSSVGSSYVRNVQVTGISIAGDDQIAINLRYIGTESAPSIVVVATASPMGMMSNGMMNGMMGTGSMMSNANIPQWNNSQWQLWHEQMAERHNQINGSQWQNLQAWHSEMMANPDSWQAMPMMGWDSTAVISSQLLVGSTVLEQGWQPGTMVEVMLEGTGSAYDNQNIVIEVYPLTS